MSTQINKKVLMTILIIGCFLSTLNQTLLNVALSSFIEVFKVSPSTVQWLATGFMLVNGILIPITAFLMKRFSTRQLFISSMTLLLIGTLFCALAPNFSILLMGRMIQAAGAGIIMPLMMSIVMFIYPPEKRGSAMGLIGFAIIFAPAIAPTLAGFILEYFSWRWLFIGLLPFVVFIIVLAFKYLINISEQETARLDVLSVILSTLGFGFLLYGFSSAGSLGWASLITLSSIITGLVITSVFCIRQLKSEDPLLNLNVFSNKTFTMTSVINVLVTMIMYADMILLPIYLQDGRGFTALDAGLLLLPGALVNAFMSPVTGKLYDKYGAKPLFIIGLLFVIPTMWVVTDLNDTTSFTFLMIRTIFLRVGLSFITMPLNTAGLNALPKLLITHGTAVNNTVRQLAGSIGTAVVVTIFTVQSIKHTENISIEMPSAGLEQLKALASIYGSSDAYVFMTILSILALILTIFFPNKLKNIPAKTKTT
ncbi:DHA2 family efflux MFS transporter permease subunit [Psychrobacillus sp. MER TA 171]|uniref:DHA2 family efflux MFS transporter permease subunit n=1 Tax=Psychrobacillus sp. MER TA 171 TaxID=2939577 RepID=UPI00203C8DFD|nr:DHA2 family efflux MFS transporter permease subunit [Psychrobacillus sp. MER TA 171]MCM3357191.1 DHA2 family efflux MFS transporter permease subunit [Psychrobacillus sp. MER TA 171]